MKNSTKGLIYGILVTIFYGLGPPISKALSQTFSPLFLSFLLNFVPITLFIFPYVLLKERANLKRLKLKDLAILFFIGFLTSVIATILFFEAIKRISATESAFLLQLETLFAFIVARIVLKEKLHLKQLLGMGVMFFGLFALITNFRLTVQIGSLLMITTAFIFGLTDVMVKSISNRIPPFMVLLGRGVTGSVLLLPFAYKNFDEFVLIDPIKALLIVVQSLVVVGILFSLYSAIRYLKTAEGTSFILPAPLITATISFIFLGERLAPVQILGGGFILGGLYFVISKIDKSP